MTDLLVPKDPLLRWRQLLPAAWSNPFPARFGGARIEYLFLARNAIYHGLKLLGLRPGDGVLAPAYHCEAAIEPILSQNLQVTYYNIHRNCMPDFDDLASKITPKTKALLAIHFFGFPQPIQRLRDFCGSHKLFLIEDCAHVLAGSGDGAPLGSFGDVSLFSWRKMFPLYDGGQLLINRSDVAYEIPWKSNNLLFLSKEVKHLIEKTLQDSPGNVANVLRGLLDKGARLIRNARRGEAASRSESAIRNYGSEFDVRWVNVPMSGLSRLVLAQCNIQEAIEKRRANYLTLLSRCSAIPHCLPMFPILPSDTCPWIFPFTVQGEDLHVRLRERGIPATTWGGVIHPSLSLSEFPDAEFLYRKVIMLPVHQDLTERDLDLMVRSVRDVIRQYAIRSAVA